MTRNRALVARWGAKCGECPFACDGKPDRPVLGIGPSTATYAFVGESPGRDESEQGKPFIGPTGREWDLELEQVPLRRDLALVVNAVACRPPLAKDERSMHRAVLACAPVLEQQVRQTRVKHVLAMGKWAAFASAGVESILTTRGFVRRVQRFGRSLDVIATWHPTYAMFRWPYSLGE